jgi:uncharacterized membrane protein
MGSAVILKIKKIPLILVILSLVWTISLFVIPATLPPGSVEYLDGNASMIDYQIKWNELPIPQRIVYTIGDLHCHQKHNRSFLINGNQMPVCTRDVGIFAGCNVGIPLVFLINTKQSPTRAFLELFLRKKQNESLKNRRLIVAIILFLCTLPILIDGLLQAFTGYESTNNVRLLTGIIFGIMYSYGTAVLISTIEQE